MGKKKRGHPDVEEILSRPWCYYCERDFDDLKILISHQKAKHFKCERCGRRLNTAGGLSVHMTQVHKETLTSVENALPNRASLDVEIFGMEGIPEDIVTTHNQRVISQFQQAEAERRAATGNPGPGAGNGSGAKKPKFESPAEIKKRLAEHKARMAEQTAGGNSGGATPSRPDQAAHSPNTIMSPGEFPFVPAQSHFGSPPSGLSYSASPLPTQAGYQAPPAAFPQQISGFQPPGAQQFSPASQAFPPPAQFPATGGHGYHPPYQAGQRAFGVASPTQGFPHSHQQSPRTESPQFGMMPQRTPSLPPPAAGLPQRPSFGAPPVNAFQMQQMHQGQALPPQPQPAGNQGLPGGRGASANSVGLTNGKSPGTAVETTASSGIATSVDDLVAGASKTAASAELSGTGTVGEKRSKKDKDKDRSTKLVYSDDHISPEEKMAKLPRYAFVPDRRTDTVVRDSATGAAADQAVQA